LKEKGAQWENRNATDIVRKTEGRTKKTCVARDVSHVTRRENQLIKEIYTKFRYSTTKNLLTRSDIPVFSGSPISIRSTSTYAESI